MQKPKSTRFPKELSALKELGIKSKRTQIFRPFESDVECFRLSKNQYLSLNVDAISEEISQGLYQDPFTMGQILSASTLSDLHAAAAMPTGFLLSSEWKSGTPTSFKKNFIAGCESILKTSKIALEGGDSGSAKVACFTGVAFGVSKSKPLNRMGALENDLLFVLGSHCIGDMPALSMSFLFDKRNLSKRESYVKPKIDFANLSSWRPFAKCSMDTSDGIFSSVYTLCYLNKLGFRFEFSSESISLSAKKYFQQQGWPIALAWANDLGDLNTLVVVAAKDRQKFLQKNRAVCIGQFVSPKMGYHFHTSDTDLGTEIPLAKAGSQPRSLAEIKNSLKEWAKLL